MSKENPYLIKDYAPNPERIEFLIVDGASGEVISHTSMKREYYDQKRADVIYKVAERAAQEAHLKLMPEYAVR